MSFFEEIADEAGDFFEDFFELLVRRRARQKKPALEITAARPAYFFALRVDNLLRLIFGASILVSAATASFLGFSTLSELLATLINSWWGRLLMAVIGLSYLMTAAWKSMHITREI